MDGYKPSITEQVIQKVQEILELPGAPEEAKVNRARKAAVSVKECPMYSLYAGREDVIPKGSDQYRPTLLQIPFTFDVLVRVAGDDSDVDVHRVWIHKGIMSRPSLDNLVMGVKYEGSEWSSEEGTDGTITTCLMHFSVEFTTNPRDLTRKS